ncbi:MAG: PaaI family thioesterase [Bdellovibrionales bacterium]
MSASSDFISMQAVVDLLAQLEHQYQAMTADFNDFAKTNTGVECVKSLIGGQFRVACHDFVGIKVTEAEEGLVRAVYKPQWFQNNSFGTTQGGSLAVPLDGIVTLAGRTLVGEGQTAVTRGLNVSYKKPVSSETSGVLAVFGQAYRGGRDIFSHGWLQDESGSRVATATAEILVRDLG